MVNYHKYQTKVSAETINQYLNFLIDPGFQGNNRLFELQIQNAGDRKVQTGYYVLKREIENHNVMIDGKNFFNQSVKDVIRTYDNIQQVPTSQGDNCATGCFLDYNYLQKHYKMIADDLGKQK